ncbi:MAG: hypothetical protein D6714_18955, partial [Bacteroidetes bacterium]
MTGFRFFFTETTARKTKKRRHSTPRPSMETGTIFTQKKSTSRAQTAIFPTKRPAKTGEKRTPS